MTAGLGRVYEMEEVSPAICLCGCGHQVNEQKCACAMDDVCLCLDAHYMSIIEE